MAGVFRYGLCRAVTVTSNKTLQSTKLVPEIKFVRLISGKALKIPGQEVEKPKPWPYKEKRFNMFHKLFDSTTARFDENTKIIVVDGPIAAGKSAFAKELAEDLGMLYMPEANLDMLYINQYGFDLRTLDDKLPEGVRSFDVKDFCKNPKHKSVTGFQIVQYNIRYEQYIDALAHLLSTGQGIVLDRSVYSDFVFLEAMHSQGYISRKGRSAYYDVKNNTITELLRPHLAIYLDVPVPIVQQRIKERNIKYEIESDVFTTGYLTAMETAYKQQYLKNISTHAELLVYDWSQGGDIEVVVEDIERIDFERFDKHDSKMRDWRIDNSEEFDMLRHQYADKKHLLMCFINVPRFDVPELVVEAEDLKIRREVYEEYGKGEKYEFGFNENAGDTGLLFKSKALPRKTLALRERIIQ